MTNDSQLKKQNQPIPLSKQFLFILGAILMAVGAHTVWMFIFPPAMTAHCAYLIENNPPELFSTLSTHQREETFRCLHLQWRYQQKAWKIDPAYRDSSR